MRSLSNLPPGCTNADIERACGGDEPELDTQLTELLVDNDIPQPVIDRIMDILWGHYADCAKESDNDYPELPEEDY